MNLNIFNKIDSNLIKIFSNYFGKAWGFISVFLCVPIYISYLGLESYAIIGIYTLVVAIISLADAGMASAVTKEFSLNRKSEYKVNLLSRIEKIYLIIFSSICVFIIFISDYLSENWISSSSISINNIRDYIILIGIGSCIQMMASVYYGAIYGIGSQVVANNYQIVWVTLKSVFVILVFNLYESSLYVFFVWQILCNILYVLVLRWYVNKKINNNNIKLDKHFKIPKNVLSYIGGMSIISIIAAMNSQIDKVVISSFFNLNFFGYYWVASYLAQLIIFISIPLASFIFPLLSMNSEENSGDIFNEVLNKFIRLLYLFLIPFSFMIFYYSKDILIFWLRISIEQSLLTQINFLIKFLIAGALFFAMQLPFYYALLAKSETKYIVYQGLIQIMIGVPLLFYFSIMEMFKYTGVAFFVSNFIGFLYITLLYLYRFYNSNFKIYSLDYLIIPFGVSLITYTTGFLIHFFTGFDFIYFMIASFLFSCLLIVFINNLKNKRKILDFKSFYTFSSN